MICISYTPDIIYAQILTHSYTLNVVYLHDNTQKNLYKNSRMPSDTRFSYHTHFHSIHPLTLCGAELRGMEKFDQ